MTINQKSLTWTRCILYATSGSLEISIRQYSEFRDNKSVSDTVTQLIDNHEVTNSISPIEIGVYHARVYSFDTRRLIAHQRAREKNPRVLIRYRKISGSDLDNRVARIFSARPWNGWVTAERYGGKNSESSPYINPVYRDQLQSVVEQQFIRFPSKREENAADSNGYLILRKQAEQVHRVLWQQANNGSLVARQILMQCAKIGKINRPAGYQFLVDIKQNYSKIRSQIKSGTCSERIWSAAPTINKKQYESLSEEKQSQQSTSSARDYLFAQGKHVSNRLNLPRRKQKPHVR